MPFLVRLADLREKMRHWCKTVGRVLKLYEEGWNFVPRAATLAQTMRVLCENGREAVSRWREFSDTKIGTNLLLKSAACQQESLLAGKKFCNHNRHF